MNYVMQSGNKEKDFIIFNSDLAIMNEDEINDSNLSLLIPDKKNIDVQNIYSTIWSCNMYSAFVIVKDGILLFDINSEHIIKCNKHSFDFIRKWEQIQTEILINKKTKKIK